ncbi:unnamed protein product [Sphagnum tenellum]
MGPSRLHARYIGGTITRQHSAFKVELDKSKIEEAVLMSAILGARTALEELKRELSAFGAKVQVGNKQDDAWLEEVTEYVKVDEDQVKGMKDDLRKYEERKAEARAQKAAMVKQAQAEMAATTSAVKKQKDERIRVLRVKIEPYQRRVRELRLRVDTLVKNKAALDEVEQAMKDLDSYEDTHVPLLKNFSILPIRERPEKNSVNGVKLIWPRSERPCMLE